MPSLPSTVPTGWAAGLAVLSVLVGLVAYLWGYAHGRIEEREARAQRAIDRFTAAAKLNRFVTDLRDHHPRPASCDLHSARFSTIDALLGPVVEEREP